MYFYKTTARRSFANGYFRTQGITCIYIRSASSAMVLLLCFCSQANNLIMVFCCFNFCKQSIKLTSLLHILTHHYVSPHEMGRHIVLSSVVCLSVSPSVLLSVRPSVRHTFVSALYLLNPWWDLQITLHKCQV